MLTLVTALSAFPLYFMLVMASRPNADITSVPPPLTAGRRAVRPTSTGSSSNPDITFGKAVVNTLLVAGVATVSVVLFSSLAGFAFAKLRFVGRQPLLAFVLLTMMVPIQLGLIPLYMLMSKLHLSGTLPAVILPFLVSGFGVFLMRQFVVQALPDELLEAARLDGASILQTFWYVVLPVLRPGRGGARAAHVHGALERLPLALPRPRPRPPDRPGRARRGWPAATTPTRRW